jgi:ABC-type transport system substrate-binding protein
MKRRAFLACGGTVLAAPALARAARAQAPKKTLRWSFPAAETGFDPAQVSDLYSNYVIANIIDAPLQYDFLARPVVLRTKTAAALPEATENFRVYTVRIRPGIYFADDPAFKGMRRELTAADHVYQFKRVFDPRWKSPLYSFIAKTKPLGLEALRKAAQASGRFDYDREVEGARVLDRYTFQIRLAEPDPRFAYNFTDARLFGAVAREVVETYGNDIMAHPVGTGPYRLVQWRRASFIALEKNPGYRDEFYGAAPPADDARSLAIAAQMKGKKLPLIDRVEITIIEDTQPQWLSFLNGSLDLGSPGEFLNLAAPGGQLAPHLARRGITLDRLINPDITVTYFNMEDPVVGGYTPEKVALRRALALAYNIDEEVRLVRRGQMLVAQSPVPPNTFGYEPDFVSEMGQFDRARAKALLDAFGYVDRDGDGWRELPDGRPLHLTYATQSDQFSRQLNELWKKNMDAIGVRMRFEVNQWPEQLKQARAGKLQIWGLGWSAGAPDGETFFELAYGPAKGGANLARFDLPRYNELFDRQRVLPDGPERLAIMREMKRLLVAYMPYKFHGHRFVNSLAQPWVIGFRRHPYARDFFKYLDIDVDLLAREVG